LHILRTARFEKSREQGMTTPEQFDPRPRFLMCRPQYFAVTYSINPWMDPAAWSQSGDALHGEAVRQWEGLLHAVRRSGATVELVEPENGLPDLVFTANSAVVLDGKALLARFRHPQRQGEEPVYAAAFNALRSRGLIDEVVTLPPGVTLEGAGDCLWDAHRQLFWMGCGFRSGVEAREVVAEQFGVPCVALALADPAFYHLDTCFSPLPCGAVMYYPAAFTTEGLAQIHARVAPTQRIAIAAEDAAHFAANAVNFGRTILVSSCSETLRAQLKKRGYTVVEAPLTVFQRSGGSACCLTLRLDHQSAGMARGAIPAAKVMRGHE
jgi:N-dimethylarginine dimethylaminohydrolase